MDVTGSSLAGRKGRARGGPGPFVALSLALALGALPVVAADYEPIYSASLLDGLDPATRARFEALESENYRRWLNRHGRSDGAAQARAQHAETEAMLQRFEASRRLNAEAAAADQKRAQRRARHQQNCQLVADEISMLRKGGLFYDTDESGVRRYLSDVQVAERISVLQRRFNERC